VEVQAFPKVLCFLKKLTEQHFQIGSCHIRLTESHLPIDHWHGLLIVMQRLDLFLREEVLDSPQEMLIV
jgi:hypothetical protein